MFKKMRFQTKLFVVVSSMISVLLIASALIVSQIMLKNTRQNWDIANRQIFHSLSMALNSQIKSMDEIAKSIHASVELKNVYQEIPEHEGNYFDRNPLARDRMMSTIYTALGSRPLNGRIAVVSRYGDYVYVDNQTGDIELNVHQVMAQETVRWGLETEDFLRVFLPETDPWHTTHEQLLTLARPLRTSYETLGVILYSIPLDELNDLCKQYLSNTDIYIALLGQNRKMFYEYSLDAAAIEQDAWYDADALAARDWYDKGHMRVIVQPLAGTDVFLAQVTGLNTLRRQIRRLQMVLLLSYLIAFIGVLLMTRCMISRLAAPLKDLRCQVDRISLDGELLVQENAENNEINALSNAISEMVQRFREQNEHLLLARERDMQSSLNAMEAQLNSHFLYNTLAVIGAVGQMEGSRTTPRLCAKLASLLRYSVDFNFKCVTLGDELQNVRDYLEIMGMRYAGQVDFVWELDETAEAITVPKLILQPIVENCFKHGFENHEGIKRIRIISRCDAVRWSVEVRNNGVPMTPEIIEGICQRFARYREELGRGRLDARAVGTGFGLGNTVLRLYLFYKGDETFRIATEGEETVVEIGGIIHAR